MCRECQQEKPRQDVGDSSSPCARGHVRRELSGMGLSSFQRQCLKVFSPDSGHGLREAKEGVWCGEGGGENRPRAWGAGSACASHLPIHPSFRFCLTFLHKYEAIMKAKKKKMHCSNCTNNSTLNLYNRSFSSQQFFFLAFCLKFLILCQ